MRDVVGVALVIAVVVVASGAVAAELTRPLWRRAPALAPIYGLMGIASAGWLQFMVSWLSPGVGRVFAALLLVAVAVLFGRFRLWRSVLRHRGMLLLALAILMAYLGLLYLWQSGLDPFSLAALRFSYHRAPYPVDNVIPTLMADRISAGQSTHHLILQWNGSDRPPLQSGSIVTMLTVVSGLGLPTTAIAFSTGVVLQLLWIPAVWALLVVLGLTQRVAALATVFTASTAAALLNTTYTWPKLLAAALVLAAMAILIAAIRGRIGSVPATISAALAFALAMLSHGGAAFALPAVAVLVIVAVRRHGHGWRAILLGALVAIAVYLPWVAYQRFADPPGDRLLKWHLAGFTGVDGRSFLQTLIESYRSLSLENFFAAKWANVSEVFSPFIGTGWAGVGEKQLGEHRFHEYYETTAALSLAVLPLAAMIVVFIVLRVRGRAMPQSRLAKLVALMVPCLLIWCLVMFLPGATVVHQGSHVWILVFIAGSFGWVASVAPRLAIPLVVAQSAITAWFYAPFFGHTILSPSGAAVLTAGVILTVATLVVGRPNSSAFQRARRWMAVHSADAGADDPEPRVRPT